MPASTTAPRQHIFAAPAGPLCWFEWGTPCADAPTWVLLHATGFHARLWDRVIAAMPAGAHVIVPDLPGHGRSYRPDTLADWSRAGDDVAALLAAVRPDGALIGAGHSMGAVCLVRTAAALPGRFAALGLIDPVILHPDAYPPVDPSSQMAPADHPVARRRARFADADAMIAAFSARLPYASWDADVLADYCLHGLLPAPDGAGMELACPPLLEASAYIGSLTFAPFGDMAALSCPVHVLRARSGERQGLLDFSISPTLEGVAECFAHGQDAQWTDHSHFIPMEAPQRTAHWLVEQVGALNR